MDLPLGYILTHMVQRAHKRTLFLIGILFASIAGVAGSYLRSNYSKGDSLFLPNVAHADAANWNWAVGSSGDGCGGCSGDASADGCADSGSDSDGCCCY